MTEATPATVCPEGGPPAPNLKAIQILVAARKIFMREGYGAASMDAIAREANVSKATLYAHFTSKDQLFAAVIQERCRHLRQGLLASELEALEPIEALCRIGRNFLDLILSSEALAIYRVVIAEGPRFKELGRAFYESGPLHVKQGLAAYFEGATRRGLLEVPEPWLAAEQFVGMLQSHFHMKRLLGIVEKPTEREVDHAIELAARVLARGYAAH